MLASVFGLVHYCINLLPDTYTQTHTNTRVCVACVTKYRMIPNAISTIGTKDISVISLKIKIESIVM